MGKKKLKKPKPQAAFYLRCKKRKGSNLNQNDATVAGGEAPPPPSPAPAPAGLERGEDMPPASHLTMGGGRVALSMTLGLTSLLGKELAEEGGGERLQRTCRYALLAQRTVKADSYTQSALSQ